MQSNNRKYQIINELDETRDKEELIKTLEHLDHYTVAPPSAQSTKDLIARIKPLVREQASLRPETAEIEQTNLPLILQLVRPQAMLLSKWFIATSAVFFLTGLALTNAASGNMLKFLANASPILGILTIFYEYRAKMSGVSELEATCPYSPAQLAGARLIVVLSYDILLCLTATPIVLYWQDQLLWQVVVSWLSPLLLMLGIALVVSLRLGIMGGCLVSGTVWALQFAVNDGNSVFSILLSKQPAVFADLLSILVGVILIVYSYISWNSQSTPLGYDQVD